MCVKDGIKYTNITIVLTQVKCIFINISHNNDYLANGAMYV